MISTLKVITPAPTGDLTVLETVKSVLNIADTSIDERLCQLIRQVSAQIEGWCRRPEGFGRETVEQTVRRLPGDSAPARLILERDLVPSVEVVTADGVDLGPDEWLLDGSLLLRLCGDRPSHWRSTKVVIRYSAGYVLLTDFPYDIEAACLDLVTRAWHSQGRDPLLRSASADGVGADSYFDPDKVPLDGGLPVEVAAKLAPYRRWSVG